MRNLSKKKIKGFTMAEALIAISIILIGVISSFLMVFKSLYDVSIIQDRLTATFLVQEGIELIRQKRDSNYLASNGSWDTGLSQGNYRIGLKLGNQGIEGIIFDTNTNSDNAILYQDPETGIFNYSSRGNKTPFTRIITITKVSDNELKVECKVSWNVKKLAFTIKAEDHLFNWLNINK